MSKIFIQHEIRLSGRKEAIMPLWKVKEKTVDEKGLTTTKTITTENTAVMQKLLDMKEEPVKDKSKKTTEAKKESKNKEPAKSKSSIVKLLTNSNFKAPTIQDPTKQVPKLRKEEPKKLEAPKKEVKPLAPKKEDKKKSRLSKKTVEGKARIEHHSRNLNSSQVGWSNHNSFDGNRGAHLKNSYEGYRHKIEFSGLTNKQKSKLLDKLYKLYEPILKYDSQWYSPMVSGPARYPQAKMDAIYDKMMKANSEFLDWWKSIEPQLSNVKFLTPKDKKEAQEATKKKEIERIKEGFNLWYNRLLEELPKYEKNGRNPKYSVNAGMAQSYMTEALKVDTALYKELFEKLNKVCNFSKNSNIYKGYKYVLEGKLSSDSIQKQEAEDNKVIYSCSDYEISNLKIDAGKRIAIQFTFYPKPQLVYALKKRGFTWYSFKKCFICKPERFDLEWAKGISKQYEKYI